MPVDLVDCTQTTCVPVDKRSCGGGKRLAAKSDLSICTEAQVLLEP